MRCLVGACVVVLGGACSVELGVPETAVIECASDAQCPTGHACNEELEVCFARTRNSAPALLLEPIGRALTTVEARFHVLDANAAPYGDDEVTVEFEYTSDTLGTPETTWWPAAAEDGASRLVGITQMGIGVTHSFGWSLVSSARAGVGEATLAGATSVGTTAARDGATVELVSTMPSVTLRARAIDRAGAATAWVKSNTALVGNDAPALSSVTLPAQDVLRGLVPVQLVLADAASDLAGVELEFRLPNAAADAWRPAAVALGAIFDLPTSPAGVTHVIVWDSAAALALDKEAPAQGVGDRLVSGASLRLRTYDYPSSVTDAADVAETLPSDLSGAGGDTPVAAPAVEDLRYLGVWTEVALPTLDNR